MTIWTNKILNELLEMGWERICKEELTGKIKYNELIPLIDFVEKFYEYNRANQLEFKIPIEFTKNQLEQLRSKIQNENCVLYKHLSNAIAKNNEENMRVIINDIFKINYLIEKNEAFE